MTDYVIGDIHGHDREFADLLAKEGLTSADGHWSGASHRLILVGDYVDRGNHGLDVINRVMRLQAEARAVGGDVIALLGNHDMMMLCAWKFGRDETPYSAQVMDQWITWGGVPSDLARLGPDHIEWLESLPAMLRIGDNLIVHADAMLYVDFGLTVDAVNSAFAALLKSDSFDRWQSALRSFAEHRAFSGLDITGVNRADQLLRLYGARRMVHGHTPIPLDTGAAAETVTEAHEYAKGRCVNVDGGIYLGSPGFLYELPASA